ncbi:MAG: hypothetical protein R3B13_26620 [Polyangiaceae bacterium]
MSQIIREISEGVHAVETTIRPWFGFELPLRSTVLSLETGGIAIVSPVGVDDALARRIEGLGRVEHLIAPNRLHYLHLRAACTRWPEAKVHGVVGLEEKCQGVRFDALLPDQLPDELVAIMIEGMPALSECVLYHRRSRTLVVADLVFNVVGARGWFSALILRLTGVHERLAQSRALRWMVKDRDAAAKSARRIFQLEFDRVVMAHGAVVEHDARERLERALGWMLNGRELALPGVGEASS